MLESIPIHVKNMAGNYLHDFNGPRHQGYLYLTRKMVPIKGRASASFSSMLKLTGLTAKKKDFEHARVWST